MFSFSEDGRYKARDLIKVPVQMMIDSPEAARIYIEFDDGEIQSTSRECIISRFAWELYSIFPHIVVSKRHHVGYATGRTYTKSTMVELLNTIKWACTFECRAHGIYPPLEESCAMIYPITDAVANFYNRITEYSVFFQTHDFLEMNHHPVIQAARGKLMEQDTISNTDISKMNSEIDQALIDSRNNEKYQKNSISKGFHSKSYRLQQYSKISGMYGGITDVDNHLFRNIVVDNLLTGLTDIRDLYMESRNAAMALFFQKDAMRQSEYLTRMLQLLAACVMRVVQADCGSTDYLEVTVRNRKELNRFKGIYYLNEETGKLDVVTATSGHRLTKQVLRDKEATFKIRTQLGCKYPSRTAICSCCYGQIADSLFPEDNVGMLAATEIQKIITQSILSTKHLVVSSLGERNVLTSDEREVVDPRTLDWTRLWLHPGLRKKKVSIRVSDQDARRLQDINTIDDVHDLLPARLSSIIKLDVVIAEGSVIERVQTVTIGAKDREGYFTYEMLEYLKEYGWSIGNDRQYTIDMSHWDWDLPFVGIPLVQYSMPAHMMAVKSMLTTTDNDVDSSQSISKYSNPKVAALALSELINKRLDIHFTHIQTVVLAYLCEDPDNFDYRIPKDKSKGVLRPYNQVMIYRDMSLAMSYEKQFDTLKTPTSYVVGERHPHPHTNAMRG